MTVTDAAEPTPAPALRMTGTARILVAVYGILALAATGRSVYQVISKFDEAPVAYSLSVVAGVVYIVATIALVLGGRSGAWRTVAWCTVGFELLGVLAVGTLSAIDQELFPDDSVWSWWGYGYLFIPLILPVLGLIYLSRSRARAAATAA